MVIADAKSLRLISLAGVKESSTGMINTNFNSLNLGHRQYVRSVARVIGDFILQSVDGRDFWVRR